ncbi:MAG TPA: carboxypeptidase-like regulatory domain-containing protein [Terriglobales bacterium]
MKKSFSVVGALIVVLGVGMIGRVRAQDDRPVEPPMSDLRFVVVKNYNGKPVRNAAVVLHPVTKKGNQAMGGLELKTDNEGQTNIDGIPYGPLRVQVLAPGFQTFGEDYQINRPEMQITVKLKRPGKQYSSYENSGDAKKPDDNKQPEQKPQ